MHSLDDRRRLRDRARSQQVGLFEDVERETLGRRDGRVGEEGVLHHLVERETLRRVRRENGADEHARLVGNVVLLDGEGELVETDVVVGRVHVAAVEGRAADQHRVGDDAQRPDVHFVAVAAAVRRREDLRSDVVGSAAERLLPLVRLAELRGESQVAHLDFEVVVQEDVRQLQVAVDDAVAVEILDCVDDLEEEVLDLRLRKTLPTLHEVAQCLPIRLPSKDAHRWSRARESSSDTDYPQSACTACRYGGG